MRKLSFPSLGNLPLYLETPDWCNRRASVHSLILGSVLNLLQCWILLGRGIASLPSPKGLVEVASSSTPLSGLTSIQHCSKFDTDQRRKECTEARLLHQPSVSRCRGKLPKDGKDSFHIIGRFQKAPSVHLSTSYRRHDRPIHKKDDEQDRRSRTTHSIGN